MAIDPALAAIVGGVDFDIDALREKYAQERDARLQKEDRERYVVTAKFSNPADDLYADPHFTRPPLDDEVDIIIIGGGFSGLLMGARLRDAGFERIRMVDKAGDFGGTWYWNRYPGACCDTESYVYMPLLEETGFVPKHKYSYGPEILAYAKHLAKHYDLYRDACFQTRFLGAAWDEETALWTVTTDRGDRMQSRFLVLSSSPFDNPKLPAIPGVNDYKGYTFHTSRWDYGYTGGHPFGEMTNLADKKVGIIGTGATGLQCIPYLAESAGHLYVFQRTPSTVDVRNQRETDLAWYETLASGWQEDRMDNFVAIVNGEEAEVDLVADAWTDIYRDVSVHAIKRRAEALGRDITPAERGLLMEIADFKKLNQLRQRIDDTVKDPATAEALKPWYRLFCKRPCFHDSYLDVFNRPNVTLVDTKGQGVRQLSETGVVVDDINYDIDCLVFATGFEVSSGYALRNQVEIIGRDGAKLSDKWREGLRTLHGLQVHGFPNCFILGFTQTAFTFLVPHSLNLQAKHASYIMEETVARGARIVEATVDAEDAWVEEMRGKAKIGRSFYASCTPGYYNNEGKIDDPFGFNKAVYGGGPMKFLKMLADWRDSGTMPGVELR